MTIHQPELSRLMEVLRADYEAAPRGEKMTALHLFGIVHAEVLAGLNGQQLDALAGAAGSKSFATELRKMVKLARHVVPRPHPATEERLSDVFRRHARPLPPGYHFDRDEANAR